MKRNLLRLFTALLLTYAGYLLPTNALADPALGYRYVRLILENSPAGTGVTINELEFLNGSVVYPKLAFTSNTGTTLEASMTPASSWQMANKSTATGAYLGGTASNESAPVTFDFKDRPIYPTAVRISKATFSTMREFRVEGSNDNTTWTRLYESPASLPNSTYFPVGNGATGTFLFGTDPVAVDVTPPTTPVLTTSNITHNSLTASWNAVTDEGGVKGYEVFLNGTSRGFTQDTQLALNYVLSPATNYTVTVVAYDKEFNASERASTVAITQPPATAVGYKYLRFWINKTQNNAGSTLPEMRWLMGDKKFPFNNITLNTGDADVAISASVPGTNTFDAPWKALDGQMGSHWYEGSIGTGKEFTLESKSALIYATGVQYTVQTYSTASIQGFRCEGSNDKTNWTILYERNSVSSSDFAVTQINGSNYAVGTFNFGMQLPADLDVTPPSAPMNLRATQTTSTSADLAWDASTDAGSGVSAYKVYVNGAQWGITVGTTFTAHALSPTTSYSVTVKAVDKLGNESTLSEPLTVTPNTLPPAIDAMALGTDFSNDVTGVWKSGVNFATEWANYATANPFNPVFLEEIKNYRVLRFMSMTSTNNNWITNWSDRRLPGDQDQTAPANYTKDRVVVLKGVAVEWMIKLCNINKSDLWVNVPHAANDDYIRQLAATVKQHLDPSLKVYIEYSNEVWGGFGSEIYATQKGKELGFDQGGFKRYAWFGPDNYARFRYYVYRTTQMFGLFNEVFGAESGRVKKVLAGWSGQPDMTRVHLDALAEATINPAGIWPDYYAIAPYFGFSGAGTDPNLLALLRTEVGKTIDNVKQHYAILSATGRNIPLITYEAGQHLTNSGEVASRNPLMYQVYIEYQNALAPYLETLVHFVHSASFGQGMAWGSKEFIGQPDLTSFKYRALMDWRAANINTPKILAPYITEQPKSQTVAEGSGVTFKLSVIGEQPMQYQWFENGQPIAEQTGSELILKGLGTEANGRRYSVQITNSQGAVASSDATLTVQVVEKIAAQKTTSTLTIDGQADPSWSSAKAYPISKVSAGTPGGEQDISGTVKMLWDNQFLYVLVNVTDDQLVPQSGNSPSAWNADGAELYIDATNDKTTAYNTNDRQMVYNVQAAGLTFGSGPLSLTGAQVAQTTIASGYQMEIALRWSELGVMPKVGNYLGFDAMLIDNDQPGTNNKDGKKSWWTTEDNSWQNPSKFGTVRLEEATTSDKLSVYHRDGDNNQTANNTIRPYLKLYNEGTTSVPYSEITIRYWLTAENFAPLTNLSVYWAALGTSKVKMKYVPLETPRQGAFGYVEYSFDSSAGTLAATSNSGEIQTGVGKQNWTSFSESDDHSFAANATYTRTDRITVYRNNTLIWGTEPAAVTPVTALKVYSENKNSSPTTNQISTHLKIANEGNLPVDYSQLTVRYWFSADGDKPLVHTLDFAELGNASVRSKFVKENRQGTDTYLELSFAPSLGHLHPASSTGIIQQRINKSDWSTFNETNDYSYRVAGPLAENARITAYLNGTLVYGQEPGAASGARVGAQQGDTPMRVVVLGNPIQGDVVNVSVSGVEGQPLRLQLTDVQGRLVSERAVERAVSNGTYQLPTGQQRAAMLLLQVSTLTERQTIKLLKE